MTRNNFFMVFQGVVVAGSFNLNWGSPQAQWLWVLISIFGLALSGLQFRMAAAGRYQILSSKRIVHAREVDLVAAVQNDQVTYHYLTSARGENAKFKSSNSTVNYGKVKHVWENLGFKSNPRKTPPDFPEECDFIGREVLRGRSVALIAIYVAIAFIWFWLAVLILQFLDLSAVPKISFAWLRS